MSRLNMNQNLPNGLPPQMGSIIKNDGLPPSSNGLGSTHTSRGSSPGLMQIPSSQLPPQRSIPLSQLPPSRSQNSNTISNLAQNYGRLSVSGTSTSQITPSGSPKPTFSTSTPIGSDKQSDLQSKVPGNLASAFSPVSAVQQRQGAPKPLRTESNDNFKNVPLESTSENDIYVPKNSSEATTGTTTDTNSANFENIKPQQFSENKSGHFQNTESTNSHPVSEELRPSLNKEQPASGIQNFKFPGANVQPVHNFPPSQNISSPSVPFNQNSNVSSNQQSQFPNAPKSGQMLNENQSPVPVSFANTASKQLFSHTSQSQQPPLMQTSGIFGRPNTQTFPAAKFPPNSMQQTSNTPSSSGVARNSMVPPNSMQQGPTMSSSNIQQTSGNVPSQPNSEFAPIKPSGFPPSSRSNAGFPPSSQPISGFPPSSQPTSGFPPSSQPTSGFPPSSQPTPGYPPSSRPASGFPPSSQPALGFPPSSQSASRFPPNSQPTSGFPASSQPTTGFPPSSQPAPGFPPSSQPASGFPPSSQPAARFPPGSQPVSGFPPNLQPTSGFPSNLQPTSGFPPNSQPPSTFSPNSTPASSQSRAQALRPTLHTNRYPTQTGQKMPDPTYPAAAPSQPTYSNLTSQQLTQNTYSSQTINAPQSQFNYQNTSATLYNQQGNPPSQSYPAQSRGGYMGIAQTGFNKLWGYENVDLLQCPNILPPVAVEAPKIGLGQDFLDAANCSPDIFRCTMTKIPETNSLLQKSRLPLGILIHPFKDLEHLPVIQCSTIVRCRACRTYINPFVFFVDAKRWKCNLCYRLNELPEEFQYDPVSKTYGDPSRRPEIKSSTIEYIAPSEYMLRPPQPAVYLFLLDVSRLAVESGYLHTFCNVLATNLSNLPGDARTQIGFLAYNSALHFYSLADGLNQPHEMTVLDIDDVFLPCPDNLIVNLHERKELISDLLMQLPNRFKNSYDNYSALGAALQAAHKMIGATGGRVTVFQAVLPNKGPGGLAPREDPSQRSNADVQYLNPANDFYKRLALECSGQQIAVDLFIVNSQYVDLATVSGISRFSGGCIYHFPLFKASRPTDNEKFERALTRYLTRKIGFEAVMRIRCTRGLAIHTFHGNFFVRSTDLLSLPNINPDAGFGMQISIEESLSDLQTVCFQAALLYTSSKGERRIRVHTLCVPVAPTLSDIINSADQQCIIGLLSKMAVDRSQQSSLSDAREAFLNVAIDVLSSYKLSLNMDSNPTGLLVPNCLKLLPLYISAMLKHSAFRTGTSTRLDDRIKAMCDMKTLPLYLLIQQVYPDLYPIHNLEEQAITKNSEGGEVPQPPRLQLSARSLENKGAYLMDQGDTMILFVCSSVSIDFLACIFGVSDYNAIPDDICELPLWENPRSQRLNTFINYLNDEKPFPAVLQVIRDNSPNRHLFIERLLEDRVENALSYHEFLQHLKTQVK